MLRLLPRISRVTFNQGVPSLYRGKNAPLALPSINDIAVRSVSASQARKFLPSDHKPHTTEWIVERSVSVVLATTIPLVVIYPCTFVNHALAFSLVMHGHWGLEAVLTDYVHGNAARRVAQLGLTAFSIFTLGTLLYFNVYDVGIGQAFKMLWSV